MIGINAQRPDATTCFRNVDAAGDVTLASYLWSIFTPEDTYFDVGANAGYYSLLAKHKGAKVHAFEPFPSTFRLLRKSCEGKDIMPWNLAVSDNNLGVRMQHDSRYPDFSGWNTVSPDGNIAVASTSLDQFGIVPTVMKIDVEGHEMAVLHGAKEMLRKHKPILIVETDVGTDFLFSLGYTKVQLLGSVRATNYLYT